MTYGDVLAEILYVEVKGKLMVLFCPEKASKGQTQPRGESLEV